MGTSTAPLILTNIPETEFALTRDFLVMHDDQLSNIINPLQNQNTEIIQEQMESVNSNESIDSNKKDICQEIADNPAVILKNHDKYLNSNDLEESERHINDKVTLCK